MSKKIHIVMKSTGEYDDSFESPYRAFTDKKKAEALAKEKNEYFSDLEERYKSIDFDVEETVDKLFIRYLQDTDSRLYEMYNKAMTSNDSNDYDEFYWENWYDKRNEFVENNELFAKYSDICNLTDDERNAIRTNIEYNKIRDENGWTMPYFYVSNKVLELEE